MLLRFSHTLMKRLSFLWHLTHSPWLLEISARMGHHGSRDFPLLLHHRSRRISCAVIDWLSESPYWLECQALRINNNSSRSTGTTQITLIVALDFVLYVSWEITIFNYPQATFFEFRTWRSWKVKITRVLKCLPLYNCNTYLLQVKLLKEVTIIRKDWNIVLKWRHLFTKM